MNEQLVALIRSQPGMAERLLAQHRDDGTGRCTACMVGAQSGRLPWPCQIRVAAEAARMSTLESAGMASYRERASGRRPR